MTRWLADFAWCLLVLLVGGAFMLAGYLVMHHVIRGTW